MVVGIVLVVTGEDMERRDKDRLKAGFPSSGFQMSEKFWYSC